MSDKRKLPLEDGDEGGDGDSDTSPPKKGTKSAAAAADGGGGGGGVEADLICPISLQLPIHPAVAGDGRIYESSALSTYIAKKCKEGEDHVKSPITRENMAITFTESPTIKSHIETLINAGSIKGELAETWTSVNEWIAKAKNGNDLNAMWTVAANYGKGNDGFPQDFKKAYEWAKRAHDAGYIPGTYLMAFMLLNGSGVAKNTPFGIMYLGIAAQAGHNLAAFYLGQAIATGKHGFQMEKSEAIKWLKVALSGECQFDHMSEEIRQKAQKLHDELTS